MQVESDTNEERERPRPDDVSTEQLLAYEQGWGAMIMPMNDGWKISYFSVPDFEAEKGTVFSTLEQAMLAVGSMLPIANSPEQRAKARADLEDLRTRCPHDL